MTHPHAIAIPSEPAADPEAMELARIWSSEGHQYFALNVQPDLDPEAWGLWAMDLMRHAARAYEQMDGRSRQDAYKKILFAFAMEMKNPTEEL